MDITLPNPTSQSTPLPCGCDTGLNVPNDGKKRPQIAFVGAPNAGKSTLFNALTGSKAKMGNWPGTTVEVSRGLLKLDANEYEVIDFPGTYSLDALSPDEALTPDMIIHADPADRPEMVIVIVDGSCLGRSLYLLSQLREHHLKIGVIITKADVAAKHGTLIDIEQMRQALGKVPVAIVDPRHGEGTKEAQNLVRAVRDRAASCTKITDGGDEFTKVDARFSWIDQIVKSSTQVAGDSDVEESAHRHSATFTERFDRIALHPIAGPILFMVAMWCVFQITTTVASPLQDALDSFFSGPVTDWVTAGFAAVGWDGSIVEGLVVNGLVAGVGTLLTFAPLMALMFICLSFLEDSGYMARAAVVTDRLMRTIGLPGKAFIPLIVGFGCNVPAISATRVLSKPSQRLLTCLLIPFASCSARLTVFAMLAATFFPDNAGTVVFGMYLISVGLIVLSGFLIKGLLRKSLGMDPLIIDLPVYQIPGLRLISSVTWLRLKGFLKTAGGIIVVTVALVFLLQSIPATKGYGFADEEMPASESVYGKVCEFVSPVFEPAGYGQWRTTGALVTGFVAKEAVISSWAQTYSLEDVTDESPEEQSSSALATAITKDFDEASGGHAIAAVWAFMIFLLAYTPCVATVAAQRREIGWKWTLFGIGIQLTMAWVLSVVVFQVLSHVL